MAWQRTELLSRLLPEGPGVVLGITLGDHWASVRERHDPWFTLVEDTARGVRQLERHDGASSVVFQAKVEEADAIAGFQLDVRAADNTDRDAVLGLYYDLRSEFNKRLGFFGDDSIHAMYNLDGPSKLWMRLSFGEDSAWLAIWTAAA